MSTKIKRFFIVISILSVSSCGISVKNMTLPENTGSTTVQNQEDYTLRTFDSCESQKNKPRIPGAEYHCASGASLTRE